MLENDFLKFFAGMYTSDMLRCRLSISNIVCPIMVLRLRFHISHAFWRGSTSIPEFETENIRLERAYDSVM